MAFLFGRPPTLAERVQQSEREIDLRVGIIEQRLEDRKWKIQELQHDLRIVARKKDTVSMEATAIELASEQRYAAAEVQDMAKLRQLRHQLGMAHSELERERVVGEVNKLMGAIQFVKMRTAQIKHEAERYKKTHDELAERDAKIQESTAAVDAAETKRVAETHAKQVASPAVQEVMEQARRENDAMDDKRKATTDRRQHLLNQYKALAASDGLPSAPSAPPMLVEELPSIEDDTLSLRLTALKSR